MDIQTKTVNDRCVISNEQQNNTKGVKGGTRAMIVESLSEYHSDLDNRIFIMAEENEVIALAEKLSRMGIEDIKINLQHEILESQINVKLIAIKQNGRITSRLRLPIQKLMYLVERRKKLPKY